MFAKICGVDLRPQHFAVGRIAQTSVAKMSGIIIRADLGEHAGLFIFWPTAPPPNIFGAA